MIAERKARYKKFDYAEFLNRDAAEEKRLADEKAKLSARPASESTKMSYRGVLGEISKKIDDKFAKDYGEETKMSERKVSSYKPPIKGGRAPRQ